MAKFVDSHLIVSMSLTERISMEEWWFLFDVSNDSCRQVFEYLILWLFCSKVSLVYWIHVLSDHAHWRIHKYLISFIAHCSIYAHFIWESIFSRKWRHGNWILISCTRSSVDASWWESVKFRIGAVRKKMVAKWWQFWWQHRFFLSNILGRWRVISLYK